MQGIQFREATAIDVAAMARCFASGGGAADSRMTAYFERRHHPQQALEPRAGYVALEKEEVIGYVAGHRTTRDGCAGEVQYLFVSPPHRRKGIGTELVRLLAMWFESQTAQQVCVPVAGDSPREARPFFESLGARPLKKNWYAWRDVGIALRSFYSDRSG